MKKRELLSSLIFLVLSIASLFVGQVVVNHISSPAAIRNPQLDHYHFRLQIVVNGQAVNFAEAKYQIPYDPNQCTTDLPARPIHFHDNKDQFVHIHWKGMTGGLVLKNYGWDFVGGQKQLLGHRYTDFLTSSVPIHGNYLPVLPDGAIFWVYTGDEKAYVKKNFEEFINKDLEDFFGKKSNLPSISAGQQNHNLDNWLFPKAKAHGVIDDNHASGTASQDETPAERLTRINNLIGSVVVFAQKDEPSNEQIMQRFDKLEPLSDSTCGG